MTTNRTAQAFDEWFSSDEGKAAMEVLAAAGNRPESIARVAFCYGAIFAASASIAQLAVTGAKHINPRKTT